KSYVWWNPFYGGVVRAAGYLSNDDPEKLVEACASALPARSAPLHLSAAVAPVSLVADGARWAQLTAAGIQPILLHCDPPAFTRSGHWYQQPPYGFRMTIAAKPLIGAGALLADEQVTGFKPRALTRALERFFTTE